MKTFFTILIIVFTSAFATAQDYKAKLTSLMKNSESDFFNIIGNKTSLTGKNGSVFYDSKLKLGVGNEFISKKENDKAAIYTLNSEYKNARELEKAVKEFITSYFPTTKYDIVEDKDDFYGTYFLEVYEKKDAFPLLEVSLEIDKDLNTNFIITLYSKSAQL